MELFKLAGALLSQPRFILACFRLHEVRLLLGLLIQFASAAYVAWDVSQFGVRPQAFMIAAAALVFAWLYVSPPRLSLSSCAKECLSGRIAVVTGGNAGLGLHLSLGLAARGATVVIACRNAVSGAAVVDAIRKAGGQSVFLPLDLSSPASVCKFVQLFTSLFRTCDILINNAGIMFVPYSTTEFGWESHMAVNHLGHAMLTALLLPEIQSSALAAGPIVVSVSSIGHIWSATGGIKPSAHTQAGYDPVRAYADSKLANIMFARWLAHTSGGRLHSVAVHPGIVDTGLWEGTPSLLHLLLRWAVMKSPAEGAAAVVSCVTRCVCGHGGSPLPPGSFSADGGPFPSSSPSQDTHAGNALARESALTVCAWLDRNTNDIALTAPSVAARFPTAMSFLRKSM